MSRPRTNRPGLALFVHAMRVVIVVALLLLIPPTAKRNDLDSGKPPDIRLIQKVLPSVKLVLGPQDVTGLWTLFDETGKPLGTVARTLPAAALIVGYRGPTEASIIFDPEMKILAVRLLQSADTQDYVNAVVADEAYFDQFKGWPWGGPTSITQIDGVSGATLTSLAMAEGILKRIDGNRPSLLFPDEVTTDDVRAWFENAAVIDDSKTVTIVRDADGKEIGRALRTGPLDDNVTGYRGPTELLMKLDQHNRVEKIKVRTSYDGEPFTGWVRAEAGFWAIFEDRTVAELAAFDLNAAGVEGVSGATMTSMAVADTIVAAAKQADANLDAELAMLGQNSRLFGIRWGTHDIATVMLLLLAGLASKSHWFQHRAFRKTWLIAVVLVIGFWAGNLVSLALIAGWSAEGIAWQLAPGLAAIATVAVVAPPTGGGNPYCNHLCPHGAIQQLVKPSRSSRRHLHPSRRLSSWLRRVPAITLIAAYVILIIVPSIDLSSWEPFHAYLFKIAGWGSIAMALASIVLAGMLPMGYCRFGCPTGSLLDYLRRSAISDRLQSGDLIAVGLLVFALIVRR